MAQAAASRRATSVATDTQRIRLMLSAVAASVALLYAAGQTYCAAASSEAAPSSTEQVDVSRAAAAVEGESGGLLQQESSDRVMFMYANVEHDGSGIPVCSTRFMIPIVGATVHLRAGADVYQVFDHLLTLLPTWVPAPTIDHVFCNEGGWKGVSKDDGLPTTFTYSRLRSKSWTYKHDLWMCANRSGTPPVDSTGLPAMPAERPVDLHATRAASYWNITTCEMVLTFAHVPGGNDALLQDVERLFPGKSQGRAHLRWWSSAWWCHDASVLGVFPIFAFHPQQQPCYDPRPVPASLASR